MAIGLFGAYGVEIEYMIVDRDTLAVKPIADEVLLAALSLPGAVLPEDEDPAHPGSVQLGEITWSNELTLHVLELKTSGPAASLDGLAGVFHHSVMQANSLLAKHNAMLLPGGMHPSMNPDREMKLWPHGYNEVYQAFNRIFDCRGHGWANLQSTHLNLPFASDEEFGKLHAAVRLVLPIIPAVSAASPMMDGALTGVLDNRLEVYRHNAKRVPVTSGHVVPEPVFTREDYDREIFQQIYKAFEPLDPAGILRDEWCNSRGAIARFGRGTIEVRVIDCQECPRADLAVVSLIARTIRALVEGAFGNAEELKAWAVQPLYDLLLTVIRAGERADISNAQYLRVFGVSTPGMTAGDLWKHIDAKLTTMGRGDPQTASALNVILHQGTLATRLVPRLAAGVTPALAELASCLAQNTLLGEKSVQGIRAQGAEF
jgi:carboxylate-amine ligase